jgi:hypothetical protein
MTNVLWNRSTRWKRAVCQANRVTQGGGARCFFVLARRWSEHAGCGWNPEAAEENFSYSVGTGTVPRLIQDLQQAIDGILSITDVRYKLLTSGR